MNITNRASNNTSVAKELSLYVKKPIIAAAHYENKVAEGSSVRGKAIFIAPDRFAGWEFCKIVKELRPDWFVESKVAEGVTVSEEELTKLSPMPMMKMVMTRDKNDPKELYDLLGTDEYRKFADTQFKDDNSNFKIAVVVDMWLTGFDVPSLDTLYF